MRFAVPVVLAAALPAQAIVGTCMGACPATGWDFWQGSSRYVPNAPSWAILQGDTLTTTANIVRGSAYVSTSLAVEPAPFALPFVPAGLVLIDLSTVLGVFPMVGPDGGAHTHRLPIPVHPGLSGITVYTQVLRNRDTAGWKLSDYIWAVTVL